ncbi:MAG: formylglycine-generating enzyme family protein [Gammaproteobacteria bacterium]
MARGLALLLVLSTLAAPSAVRAAPADLSGEWYFDVVSQNGPGRRDVLIRQEGSRVIGFIESDSASGRFVGTVNGASLQFTAVLEFGGEPMAAEYRAQVAGDSMAGTIDFGLYGRATFTGHRGRRPAEGAGTSVSESGSQVIEGSARTAGIAAASAGDSFGTLREGVLLPEMVAIPAGRFLMGNASPVVKPEYGADFAHLHPVDISAFRMSRFLVTNAQFAAFCAATGREPPLAPRGWAAYGTRYPNHPAINVNFDDASAYVAWLAKQTGDAYRLPTEAEWEYAARGGQEGWNFVSGDQWRLDAANTAVWRIGRLVDRDGWKAWWDSTGEALSKSRPMTTRVGSFPPNGFGLYDMAGNVWQWTRDWYQADYYQVSPAKDPPGPATGAEKVLRGCSWYNQPDVCFIATRDRYAPDRRLYYNGFRVAAGNEAP